jgi:hypothetical protein
MAQVGGPTQLKLTQKVPDPDGRGRQGELAGLVLAEVEFATLEAAAALRPAAFCRAEVAADRRFTGGALARASGEEIRGWAREYGVEVG